MSLLKKAVNEQAFLKAGILGFPGSGKSFTASMLAEAISKQVGAERPVAFFDTEAGSDFLIPKFEAAGLELTRLKSKAFSDLLTVGKEAEGACSVLIVDSITHVWNELCEAFLNKINTGLKKKNRAPLKRLEFQHWAEIKRTWAEWTAFYLNSRLHIIVCGRAGYEYEFVENEETDKKELQKVGTKMRVEGEFGFEPSLLIEMERASRGSTPGAGWIHRAHVLKDRTDSINGKAFDFGKPDGKKPAEEWRPVYEAFKPVLAKLNIGGAHISVDTTRNSQDRFDEQGESDNTKRAKRVTIACEEVTGIMSALWPGQDAQSKKVRQAVLKELFGTYSWTAVESKRLEDLEWAVRALRDMETQQIPTDPESITGLLAICKDRTADTLKVEPVAQPELAPVEEAVL
jgi:hypothetical protein